MKSPSFQFYPSDWLSSRAVRLMDPEQRGWYIQLLAEAWESEPQATLPNDEPLLRVLAGVNSSSTGVEQRWEFVRSQFKKRGAVVYNERQMEEVVRQEVNRKKKSEAGKASAEARRVEREVIKTQHLSGNERGNRRSTGVGNPLAVRSNTTPTESNLSLSSSLPLPISSSKEKPEEARTAKPRSPGNKVKLCDEEFLADLQSREAYRGLNVRRIHSKLLVWCENKRKQPTRGRLIAWLNNEDEPMLAAAGNGTAAKAYTAAEVQRMKEEPYESPSRR